MEDHGAAVDVGVASDKGHAWFFSVFTIGNIDFENIRGRAFFDIGDSPVMSWIGQFYLIVCQLLIQAAVIVTCSKCKQLKCRIKDDRAY